MRAQEFLRKLADLIDIADDSEPEAVEVVDVRAEQIKDLVGHKPEVYSNEPQEGYAEIDAVIGTGDDVNKSKHPSDIRANSLSMYPAFQAEKR